MEREDPRPGGPFSALGPTLGPEEGDLPELVEEQEAADPNAQPAFRWDEFGFRVEEEDGPEDSSSKLLSLPFTESPRRRLQWAVLLELDKEAPLPIDRLNTLVREGVPHSLRPALWPRLLDTRAKRARRSSYGEVVTATSGPPASHAARQIEKDLLRTLPSNFCFQRAESPGVPRLRRVLRGIAHLCPAIGYCQGMGMVAASLLLFLPEEDAFWMMACIVEDLLPASYYSANLWGAQADQLVFRSLIAAQLPAIDSLLTAHSIEISLISLHWFLTLFTSALHIKLTVRVWDRLFHEGNIVMFHVALAMLHLSSERLLAAATSAEVFTLLAALPGTLDDGEALLAAAEAVCGDAVTSELVEQLRRRHLSAIMAADLPSHPGMAMDRAPAAAPRRLNRSRSIVDLLLRAEAGEEADPRCKNVRRTELFVFLREAILRVGAFFQGLDPAYHGASLAPDYSLDSHAKDLAVFMASSRGSRTRRARALTDFERSDDDELGFRKNDLIVILNERDEHCWVGELNGLVGWFPAKLVQPVDERSKQYSHAGDDRVHRAITDIVRGSLCPALQRLLEQGLRAQGILPGASHPWAFVMEAAAELVAADYNSVFSRLVLCKAFRLEEEAKVLGPEELLYRCVHLVNRTHDRAGATNRDVKLRSLVCLGLNEQVLHLWLECLCGAEKALEKWYTPHSLLASPGWVLLKCELRSLAQFAFQLSADWELGEAGGEEGVGRAVVQDMLVTHHLFSWDT